MVSRRASKPIILKELCRACGIRQTMIGKAVGMSRSAINLTCNRGYIPVDPPDFKDMVEGIIRSNGRALQWLRDRGLTVSDVWRKAGNPQNAARAGSRDNRGIPQRLKRARLYLFLPQTSMAKTLGISAIAWQRYELGKNIPGALVIAGLVDLGFDANWILTGAGGRTVSEEAQNIEEHATC